MNTCIKIDQITETIQVRKIQERIIKDLEGKINKIGFKNNFPLLVNKVNSHYKLIDGNHRLQALKNLNLQEVPVVIIENILTDSEEKKLAWESNEASETIAKTTFVDCAEFIWNEAIDKTQEEIAGIMGWSREKVRDYYSLKRICKEAWGLIGATFETTAPKEKETTAPKFVALAPNFSEGLLRSILSLTPSQQMELVQEFISGNITKNKFKILAQNYKARNEIKEYLKEKLPQVESEFLNKACFEADKGIYDKEWQEKKTEKIDRLINSITDEWQKKNSIQLINGDFYEKIKTIPDNSIDLIITDPPYNVSNEQEFILEGRSNISQNFGEWDKYSKEEFIKLFDIWADNFYRILKNNGSGYIFTSDIYISFLRETLEKKNLKVKASIVWHKSNPGTQIIHTNFKSSIEYIIFFTKCESGHLFNWQGENEMHNFIENSICQGNERIKDNKGNTLHPTQKPEKIIKHFVEISSNRGDLVFDGFMGVGTTAKVSKDMGRKFIGIEQDNIFFEATQRRLL